MNKALSITFKEYLKPIHFVRNKKFAHLADPGKYKTLVLHLCAWTVYAGFLFLANYIANPALKITSLLILVPYSLTFYVSLGCLQLNKTRSVIWSIVSFILVFFTMTTIAFFFVYYVLPLFGLDPRKSDSFPEFVKSALLAYVQVFAYAMLYYHITESFKKERQLRKLQEEKLLHELENSILKQQELKSQKDKLLLEYAFLRSQVNPHFLHNTLNVLFSQALEYSDDLAENIAKLSRMMRYSLESVEYESDKVFVQKELDNLHLLIEINNIRFSHSKVIDYTVEGEILDQMLPPLSMITVVENAFKYGDLKDPANPLQIRVRLRPGQVYFFCRNKMRKNNLELSSHNIGMSNLCKRLDVAFKGKYKMHASDDSEFYTFELTVNT